MSKTILDSVVQALQDGGIPAQLAYPGRKLPALTECCAAVCFKQVDRNAEKAEVLVTVLAPAVLGGAACEKTALAAGKILQDMGAECVQEACVYDSRASLFSVEVSATFAGTALPDSWSEPLGFAVTLAGKVLGSVTAFTAWRSVDETATVFTNTTWYFRLEELFLPGIAEESSPEEPFTVVLKRPGQTETYTGCTWTSQKRETLVSGTKQIREGIVGSRSVSA